MADSLEEVRKELERIRREFHDDMEQVRNRANEKLDYLARKYGGDVSEFKVGDHVRVLWYPENDINGYAEVVQVTPTGVIVTNMNMPYSGTLANQYFPKAVVRLA